MRPDQRAADELRGVTLEVDCTRFAHGSVLVVFGETRVWCTATLEDRVPPFLAGSGSGWVTAEYAMLPASAEGRVPRDHVRKGRAMEISRLIGRSLRCVTNLGALGERQITVDCDVLQADGGTRTAAITGTYVALYRACSRLHEQGHIVAMPLEHQCAAVSVGIVDDEPRLDLCYAEDVVADVDMNVVMREDGSFIEVQGSAEGQAFSRPMLEQLLDLAQKGNDKLFALQRNVRGFTEVA